MKKSLIKISVVLLVLVVGVFLFLYYAQLSEGVRSGVVVKISKKGVVFKTAEGQLNLQTFGAAGKNEGTMNEVFEFSVPSDRDDIYGVLEDVSLTGERVSLHYVERYASLPWRGETTYFIEEVERTNEPQSDPGREDPYSH